jgi:hypothetical protein
MKVLEHERAGIERSWNRKELEHEKLRVHNIRETENY